MDLKEASLKAIRLMDEHGLLDKHWYFEFDNAKRRAGMCDGGAKRISLSKHITKLNSEREVINTILHEIAHALVGCQHGHNTQWKNMCIKIGARPERCFTSDQKILPDYKYTADCGGCGKTHGYYKKPDLDRKRACKCQHDKKWDEKVLLIFKEVIKR
jgi:predicted SprT family Zn-dependent metalloprotease